MRAMVSVQCGDLQQSDEVEEEISRFNRRRNEMLMMARCDIM